MGHTLLIEPIDFGRAATRAVSPRVQAGGFSRADANVTSDWREQLPVVAAHGVTVRELRASDAPALLAMLTTEEVTRFVSPPPTTVDGFVRFIEWSTRERAAGRSFVLGIVPDGFEHAVGLIQMRALDAAWSTAEWGFALGTPFWGRGVFYQAACAALDIAFGTLGAHRVEARAAAPNGRGNGALRKLGAVQEGCLRQSFAKNGGHLDQLLWSILGEDWRRRRVH